EGIVERIREIASKTGPDDAVLLYLAGHGEVPAGQGLYYFLPVDARNGSLRDYRQTALSSADLADLLRQMRSRRVITIMDTCQSGGALEGLAKAAESVALDEMEASQIANLKRQPAARNNPDSPDRDSGVGIYLVASASPFKIAAMPVSGPSALVSS